MGEVAILNGKVDIVEEIVNEEHRAITLCINHFCPCLSYASVESKQETSLHF